MQRLCTWDCARGQDRNKRLQKRICKTYTDNVIVTATSYDYGSGIRYGYGNYLIQSAKCHLFLICLFHSEVEPLCHLCVVIRQGCFAARICRIRYYLGKHAALKKLMIVALHR